MDASVGTRTPLSEPDEAVSGSPQKPSKPKQRKKRRPCKGQRDRAKKRLAALEHQVGVPPHDVDVAEIVLPGCRTERTQRALRALLQHKRLDRWARALVESWDSYNVEERHMGVDLDHRSGAAGQSSFPAPFFNASCLHDSELDGVR